MERRNVKKLILLVEDDKSVANIWKEDLGDKGYEVIWADSVEKATELFAKHGAEICGIVMDACVPGDRPNTFRLVHLIRQTFKGHMVAASSIKEYQELLRASGCDLVSEKFIAAQVLIAAIEADEEGNR